MVVNLDLGFPFSMFSLAGLVSGVPDFRNACLGSKLFVGLVQLSHAPLPIVICRNRSLPGSLAGICFDGKFYLYIKFWINTCTSSRQATN